MYQNPDGSNATHDSFGDALVGAEAAQRPAGFFDRFMFNLHPAPIDGAEIAGPELIVGAGVYPGSDTVDGFLMCVAEDEQRNLRFSSELSASARDSVGPLTWTVVEPGRRWKISVGPNPAGVEIDALWTARAPEWSGTIRVANDDSMTEFDHLFQSGHFTGEIRIDGVATDIGDWFGQRDRSRGIRTMSGGQGLHLWVQPQFKQYSVGLLYVEGRDGSPLLLRGAVMHEAGDRDEVVDLEHDLRFSGDLDFESGTLRLLTASGRRLELTARSVGSGGYMAGAGYGGQHGAARGRNRVEHDRYRLDGTTNPRTATTALTDRLTAFSCEGEAGVGIFEFAHSRSPAYRYHPGGGRRQDDLDQV